MRRVGRGSLAAVLLTAALSLACGSSPDTPTGPTALISAASLATTSTVAAEEGVAAATTMAVTSSSTPVDGWCSVTGYRCAETGLQQRIVARARYASGSSGPSVIGVSPTWLTDAAGGDGLRMRTAIKRYIDWTRAPQPKVSQTEIERQMRNDFAATYDSSQQYAFVARIKARTPIYPPYFIGPIPYALPTTDQAALDYLGIRRQCKEWVDTLVREAGGRTYTYAGAPVVSATSARPGMGFFKLDSSHAALIIDVRWQNGTAVEFQLAEANMGGGWPKNPPGQVPWERTVRTDRKAGLSGYKIVRFE
jgi:hypothetical protein